ncbi:Winged helix-turn-helix DNA-binding protein [uncultured archaeon]|nr:Winged helix-turn-helix DNA-binding protein [uncultured archaeon]
MIFPINKSKYRILKEIYAKPGIKISELCKKTKASSNICYFHLKNLRDSEIVKEETIGKKPQIRALHPNIKSENGKAVFSLLENQKRLEFFEKYKSLKGCFFQISNNMPKYVLTVLVFGSYSRFAATKESDLDLLFIVSGMKNLQELENLVEEAFVTFGREVSSRILTEKEFLGGKKEDALIKSLVKEHICAYNSFGFLEILAKE